MGKLAASEEWGYRPHLIKARSSRFPDNTYRSLGWALATLCALIFYLGPFLLILPLILSFVSSHRTAIIIFIIDVILVYMPVREWKYIRGLFQLLYDVFDFHHNMDVKKVTELGKDKMMIICMHPHGVIPMNGFLWTAFCDQYLKELYGFGATTNIALYLPILRNVMGWVNCGSADRDVIRNQLESGVSLYILPGGVAEIFLSEPGTNKVIARRYGLMKMALQTGSCLVPCYVFGVTDIFYNLATFGNTTDTESTTSVLGSILERISRFFKGGFTFFWGQFGLPIPFPSKLSLVCGDPIWPVPNTVGVDKMANGKLTCKKIPNPTNEQVEELLGRYVAALERLFDQYKDQAGHPHAKLQVY